MTNPNEAIQGGFSCQQQCTGSVWSRSSVGLEHIQLDGGRNLALISLDRTRSDVHSLRIQSGDQLLLCTDGLTDMVPDTQIAQCLDEGPDAQAACEALITHALAAGGKDNVTAILARTK